jgi:hypothetical protein
MGDERYLAFIEHGCPKSCRTGHVSLCECPRCGFLEWGSTNGSKPNGYSVEPLDQCQNCAEAFHRSPELVRWVLGVVSKAMRDRAAASSSLPPGSSAEAVPSNELNSDPGAKS